MIERTLPQAVVKLLEREGTGISWADLTMNFWIGCQEVSPACKHCYARDFTNARVNAARKAAGKPPIEWGPSGARYQTSESNRRKPLRWNRVAAEAGVRLRVFCSSLSDWADNAVPDEWRAEIAEMILATPHLDWMLLTKRIGNAEKMLRKMFPQGVPSNVWLGITVCNQEEADRDIPKLVSVTEILGIDIAWLSMEPLLGAVEILADYMELLGLVIVGGESGSKARPIHPDWVRALRDECAAAGVAFHFKQWGEYLPVFDRDVEDPDWRDCSRWQHERPKGRWHNLAGGTGFHGERVVYVDRVGTRKAGHLLDGREHREMPAHG